MLKRIRAVVALATAAVGVGLAAAGEPVVDSEMPDYSPTTGVAGVIKSIGSDTMNNLMTAWGEEFRLHYPGVKVEIDGKGSSTAPPALAQGQAQFGPMSRQMKESEVGEFRDRYGYDPTLLRTGIDALAVFVHKDCPLDSITMEQLQAAFSVDGPDMTWGDLGVTDPAWSRRPVSLYGRNSASGTYSYFKKIALGGSDYKATVKEQPGSSSVVQGVGRDLYGMGYSGVGYRTADVKMLEVDDGYGPYSPSFDNALSGDYPIARFLYVYVNKDPRSEMDPLTREFARLVFSRTGQEAVIKYRYYPVPAAIAREELQKIGVEPGF